MVLPLLLSTFAAGLIATAVMVFFLNLPRLWDAPTYDVMGALGSAITGNESPRARFMGTTAYFLVGIAFALLYGWIVMAMLDAPIGIDLPRWPLLAETPLEIDLLYPLFGALVGLVHGIVIALLITIVVIEHHPIPKFRTRVALIPSQVLAHVIFGATVMFFHHQFLQLLLGQAG